MYCKYLSYGQYMHGVKYVLEEYNDTLAITFHTLHTIKCKTKLAYVCYIHDCVIINHRFSAFVYMRSSML